MPLVRRLKKNVAKQKFANEYREKFIEFVNEKTKSGTLNTELYHWLTKNSAKIQSQLGTFAVMDYKPPFANYFLRDYQLIINGIPKFRSGTENELDITSIDDSLVRYSGFIEDILSENAANLKNPIIWFREGIKNVLSLPIYILYWFGIMQYRTVAAITSNLFFKILTGLAALIAVASGVVTIINGKDKTVEWILDLFGK